MRDDSDYVYLNGVRYPLVPQEEVVEIQPQDLEQNYRWPRFTRLNPEQANETEFKRKVIDTKALGVRPYFGALCRFFKR